MSLWAWSAGAAGQAVSPPPVRGAVGAWTVGAGADTGALGWLVVVVVVVVVAVLVVVLVVPAGFNTAQATRVPLLPAGSVISSSIPAWITSAVPSASKRLVGPGVRLIMLVVAVKV